MKIFAGPLFLGLVFPSGRYYHLLVLSIPVLLVPSALTFVWVVVSSEHHPRWLFKPTYQSTTLFERTSPSFIFQASTTLALAPLWGVRSLDFVKFPYTSAMLFRTNTSLVQYSKRTPPSLLPLFWGVRLIDYVFEPDSSLPLLALLPLTQMRFAIYMRDNFSSLAKCPLPHGPRAILWGRTNQAFCRAFRLITCFLFTHTLWKFVLGSL